MFGSIPAPDADPGAWVSGLAISTAPEPVQTEVLNTPEFRRVRDAPREDWRNAPDLADGAARITAHFRTPHGTQECRLEQAAVVRAVHDVGSCFANLKTGEGKTLAVFLAAEAVNAQRPLLVVPAKLLNPPKGAPPGALGKTHREHAAYSQHWRLRPIMPRNASKKRGAVAYDGPAPLRVVSYEALGRDGYRHALETWNPDFLALDEAHKARHTDAAVTKTIGAFVRKAHPEHVLALSASPMNRQTRELAHVLRWLFGDNAPIPREYFELRAWGYALDEKVPDPVRLQPGALLDISPPEANDGDDDLTRARRRFGRRLFSCPGVIGSNSTLPPISLVCSTIQREPAPEVLAASRHMRTHEETPCGIPMEQPALEIWAHEQELSCDFYYVWDQQPPFEWKVARSTWARFVRETLSRSRSLFSGMDVANAVDRGRLDDGGALAEWRRVAHMFKPDEHRVAVWLTDSNTRFCAEWLHRERGIVWIKHVEFGKRLSQMAGVPYFGAGAMCNGKQIDQHDGPAIASIKSVSEGFNLQLLHSRNLVATTDTTGLGNEQMISRTHRAGQLQDEVTVEYMQTLDGDREALRQARADARGIQDRMLDPQRLVMATWLDV